MSERYQYLEAEEESKRTQTAPSPSKVYLKKLSYNQKGPKFKSQSLSVIPKLANVARQCSEGDEPRDIQVTETCLQTLEFLLLGEDAVLRAPLMQRYLVDIIKEIRRNIYSSRVGVPAAAEPDKDRPSSIGCAPFFEVADSLQKSHDEQAIKSDKLAKEVKKLRKELEEERETTNKLKNENGQMKYRVMQVEKDNKRLTKDFKFVQSSYLRASEEFRNMQAKTIDLSGQLATCQTKLDNSNAKVSSMDLSLRESEDTIRKLERQVSKLEDLVADLKDPDPK